MRCARIRYFDVGRVTPAVMAGAVVFKAGAMNNHHNTVEGLAALSESGPHTAENITIDGHNVLDVVCSQQNVLLTLDQLHH